MEFDNMDSAAGGESEYEYQLTDFETFDFPDDPDETATVVGELLDIAENVGKYDSTAYLLSDENGEKVMVWGNGSINAGFDNAPIETGDTVGIRQTGETYENDYGEFSQYEVRFQKADE